MYYAKKNKYSRAVLVISLTMSLIAIKFIEPDDNVQKFQYNGKLKNRISATVLIFGSGFEKGKKIQIKVNGCNIYDDANPTEGSLGRGLDFLCIYPSGWVGVGGDFPPTLKSTQKIQKWKLPYNENIIHVKYDGLAVSFVPLNRAAEYLIGMVDGELVVSLRFNTLDTYM